MAQGRSSGKLWFALILLVVIAAIFGGAGFIIKAALSPYEPASSAKVIFEVEKGSSPAQIGRSLESRGLVRNGRLFYWVGKARGDWARLKAGEYEISPSMSTVQILNTLVSGVSVAHALLIREGENIYEVGTRVEERGWGTKERFVALAKDPHFIATLGLGAPSPATLEGYLFPDTYHFARRASAEEMLRTMVRRFMTAWGPEEIRRAAAIGMTRNQVITLASIVEKETGAPEERPMISGVFHNRLKKKMKLQTDPTVIYGMWSRYQGNIHRSDLLTPSPYNTYVIYGLPPGPISNPGSEAIHAALHPAQHSFLYFVSHNDGTHEFTATYEDHLKAVKSFQIDPRAREGKSWRDLKKATPGATN